MKVVELSLYPLAMSKETERLEFERVRLLVEFVDAVLISADIRHEIAGSYRRMEDTIGDLDIVVEDTSRARNFLPRLGTPFYTREGKLKHSIISYEGIIRKIEWYWASPRYWGAMLLYATGSNRFNIWIRTYARNKGFKLNQYGLFDLRTGAFVAGTREVDIFKALGFQYILPNMRSQTVGEITWWKWAHEKKIASKGGQDDI